MTSVCLFVEWMAPMLCTVVCAAFLAVLVSAKPTTSSDETAVELRMPEVQPKMVGCTATENHWRYNVKGRDRFYCKITVYIYIFLGGFCVHSNHFHMLMSCAAV